MATWHSRPKSSVQKRGTNSRPKLQKTNIATATRNLEMGVSKNRGTPKSSILIGFSIINHPFWGTSIFGNIQISDVWQDFSTAVITFECWNFHPVILIIDDSFGSLATLLEDLSVTSVWQCHGNPRKWHKVNWTNQVAWKSCNETHLYCLYTMLCHMRPRTFDSKKENQSAKRLLVSFSYHVSSFVPSKKALFKTAHMPSTSGPTPPIRISKLPVFLWSKGFSCHKLANHITEDPFLPIETSIFQSSHPKTTPEPKVRVAVW